MYAPLGKCFNMSSGRHSLLSIDGLRTRALRAAEATGVAIFVSFFLYLYGFFFFFFFSSFAFFPWL